MASPNPASVLHVPGSISFNGVGLGEVKFVEFRPNVRTRVVTAEEFGNTAYKHFVVGSSATLSLVLRNHDSSVLSSIFPSTSPNVISGSGQPGTDLADKAGQLVFTPRASGHPGLTIYNAVPLVDDMQAVRYAWNDEWGVFCVFHAIPDSGGRLWSMT